MHSLDLDLSTGAAGESEEQYRFDTLGNKVWGRRTSYRNQVFSTTPVYPTVEYYAAGTLRDTGTVDAPGTYPAGQVPAPHSIRRIYDLAGNLAQTQEVNPVRLGLGTVIVGGGAQARTDYVFPTSNESIAASFYGQQQIATTYTYHPDGKLVRARAPASIPTRTRAAAPPRSPRTTTRRARSCSATTRWAGACGCAPPR
ncbi:MAG TPA: hypothetical protein VFJ16_26485 [Longimicrobium sp.]|nr:hypothetical protein [Longimicrobium sp.]